MLRNKFNLFTFKIICNFILSIKKKTAGIRKFGLVDDGSSFSHNCQFVLVLDRVLARIIYVREVKRFDPFKFTIYAWYIKIAIAGSLTPVRLAWVPFLRVPKNWFIYVEADTKKLYAGL